MLMNGKDTKSFGDNLKGRFTRSSFNNPDSHLPILSQRYP